MTLQQCIHLLESNSRFVTTDCELRAENWKLQKKLEKYLHKEIRDMAKHHVFLKESTPFERYTANVVNSRRNMRLYGSQISHRESLRFALLRLREIRGSYPLPGEPTAAELAFAANAKALNERAET